MRDSLRSVYPWFILFGLLLLRRQNRNRRAWAILLPLLAIYGFLYIVENRTDGSMTWYVSIYIRSFVYETLRALALGLALLLAVSDSIRARSPLVRRILAFTVVLVGGIAAILLSAPIAANPAILAVAFAFIALVSALGLSIIGVLLRWLLGRHDLRWHAGVYLALCVGPALIIEGVRLFSGSRALLSVIHQITMATAVSQVLFAPYFVFLGFALLALQSPWYRQRLACCLARDFPQASATQA